MNETSPNGTIASDKEDGTMLGHPRQKEMLANEIMKHRSREKMLKKK